MVTLEVPKRAEVSETACKTIFETPAEITKWVGFYPFFVRNSQRKEENYIPSKLALVRNEQLMHNMIRTNQ